MGCASSSTVSTSGHGPSGAARGGGAGGAALAPGITPGGAPIDDMTRERLARFASTSSRLVGGGGAPAILGISRANITERYTLGKVLGKGAYGEVRLATRKADGLAVGIKIISKLKFKGEEEHQYMLTEVELHSKVKGHPNVTELYEWTEDLGNFYMVLE